MTYRNTISQVIESLFEDWIDKNINVHPLAVENMRILEADAIALLKEQEAKPVEVCGQGFTIKYGYCPKCGKGMDSEANPHWCGFCGQAVKWE